MQNFKPMRDFALEVYFSKWEFSARHHMTASDLESMTLGTLLAMAGAEERQAFEDLWLGYTETWGAPDLRQEIAATYATMAPENILCLAGAGEGIYALAKVLLGPDDHAIVPTPNYQSAETVPLSVCAVSGVPMRRDTNAKGGWVLDVQEIKAAIRSNTKLISLNFPANPTGHLMARDDLDALIAICRERGIYLLSDEVYRGVELDPTDQMPQIADVYERGLSLNVMSKAYGLPGLRIGWLASADRDVLQRVERYKHYLSIANSAPSERLALIALRSRKPIFARNLALMQRNTLQLESLFNDYPGLVEWHRPMGGCVAFPRFTGPGGVDAFCKSLLEENGVLLLPSSIYASELTDVPRDHFRIGIGRDAAFTGGLAALRQHFETKYPSFAR